MSLLSMFKSLFKQVPPPFPEPGFPQPTMPCPAPQPPTPANTPPRIECSVPMLGTGQTLVFDRLPLNKRPVPTPGQTWIFENRDGSPWAKTTPSFKATILDVKQGWVRYAIVGNSLLSDERATVNDFRHMFYPSPAEKG